MFKKWIKVTSILLLFVFSGYSSELGKPSKANLQLCSGTNLNHTWGTASLENIRGRGGKAAYLNQDRCFVKKILAGLAFGVFDGHGSNGAKISQTVMDLMVKKLEKIDQSQLKEEEISLIFQQVNSELEKKQVKYSGTTGVLGILNGSQLVVAYVGDSRLILMRDGKQVDATTDHTAAVLSEEKRIEEFIEKLKHNDVPLIASLLTRQGFSREEVENWDSTFRGITRDKKLGVDGNKLAVTRAFGDDNFTLSGLSCEPGWKKIEVKEGDTIIVVSDGIFEGRRGSPYEQNAMVISELKDSKAAPDLKTLAESLTAICRGDDGKNDHQFLFNDDTTRRRWSKDDITVCLIKVNSEKAKN